MKQLYTHFEPAPFGGVHAHVLEPRGDEWLALVAATADRADLYRKQRAERAAMVDAMLVDKLAMLAHHRCELREINDRINHIRQLGA
jgi:hypothetical protein